VFFVLSPPRAYQLQRLPGVYVCTHYTISHDPRAPSDPLTEPRREQVDLSAVLCARGRRRVNIKFATQGA